MGIVLGYRSVDGFSESRTFKTLAGARKYAHARVGAHPEFGSDYAVSSDGIGRIRFAGTTLADLFPSDDRSARDMTDDEIMAAIEAAQRAEDRARMEAAYPRPDPAPSRRSPRCTCSEAQLDHVGCDCGAEDDDAGLAAFEMAAESAWLRAAEYDPEAQAFEDHERSQGKVDYFEARYGADRDDRDA